MAWENEYYKVLWKRAVTLFKLDTVLVVLLCLFYCTGGNCLARG